MHGSLAHALQRHSRLSAEQAHRDLASTHLEREDDRRHVVLDRRGPSEVESKGRLSERRPSSEDDELAWVQTIGQLVQLGEAGGDADHLAAAALRRLDLVDRRRDRVGERHEVLRVHTTRDGVDLSLGVVDEVDDLALARVPHLHDAGTRFDQPAEHGLLGDDGRIEAGVRGRGYERGQGVQVLGAAGPGELAGLGQLVRYRNHVGRFAMGVQRQHRVEDDLVLGNIEVDASHDLDDVGDRILAEEHAANSALLG